MTFWGRVGVGVLTMMVDLGLFFAGWAVAEFVWGAPRDMALAVAVVFALGGRRL